MKGSPITVMQYLAAGVIGLLALALGLSTYQRWAQQQQAREALAAFYSINELRGPERTRERAWAEARKTLGAWSDSRAAIIKAGFALREGGKGFAEAEDLYRQADAARPGDPAPKIGRAVAALRRAEREPGEAGALIEAALKAAQEAEALGAAFEAKLLRAAITLNKGEYEGALAAFREAGEELKKTIPDRETLVAYYWNRGLAELLAGSARCVRNIARALQLRPDWPEAQEALTLAIEVTLSRPGASKASVTLAEQVAEARYRAGRAFRNRYGLNEVQVDRVRNAVAVAYARVGDYEPAREMLKKVTRKAKGAVTYRLNYVEVCRRHGEQLTDPRAKGIALSESARTALAIAPQIKDPKLRCRVLLTAAAVFFELKSLGQAGQAARLALETKANDAECHRALGIINLRSNRSLARQELEKAIALKHPKAAEIQAKIAELGL